MNNLEFWKKKLSSRKFWAAIVGVVTALCVAFGVDGLTTEQIVAIVSSLGVLVAYIVSETCLDMKKSSKAPESEEKEKTE